jgi:hypothetical protein
MLHNGERDGHRIFCGDSYTNGFRHGLQDEDSDRDVLAHFVSFGDDNGYCHGKSGCNALGLGLIQFHAFEFRRRDGDADKDSHGLLHDDRERNDDGIGDGLGLYDGHTRTDGDCYKDGLGLSHCISHGDGNLLFFVHGGPHFQSDGDRDTDLDGNAEHDGFSDRDSDRNPDAVYLFRDALGYGHRFLYDNGHWNGSRDGYENRIRQRYCDCHGNDNRFGDRNSDVDAHNNVVSLGFLLGNGLRHANGLCVGHSERDGDEDGHGFLYGLGDGNEDCGLYGNSDGVLYDNGDRESHGASHGDGDSDSRGHRDDYRNTDTRKHAVGNRDRYGHADAYEIAPLCDTHGVGIPHRVSNAHGVPHVLYDKYGVRDGQ